MSSVTSTDAPAPVARDFTPAREAASLRPWHFFILASLMAATAAVVLSRDAAPSRLILTSLTIGAAGLAGIGAHRTLWPLVSGDFSERTPLVGGRTREAIEREKTLVLRSIKELEFDFAMGKLSPSDFDEMGGRLRALALNLMRQLDKGTTAYRALIERDLKARARIAPVAAAIEPAAAAIEPVADAGIEHVPASVAAPPVARPGRPDRPDRADNDEVETPVNEPSADETMTPARPECPACFTENDADARFCKNCGMSLGESAVQ